MKRAQGDELRRLRAELFEDIDAGRVDIADATRRMRRIVGMSRQEYANTIVNVSFETLQAIETRSGNPTLKTLNAVGKPFGLVVGFIRSRAKE